MRNPIILAAALLLAASGAMAQSNNAPNAANPPSTTNDVAKGGTAYSMGANQNGVPSPLAGKNRHAGDVAAKNMAPKPKMAVEGQAKQDVKSGNPEGSALQ